MKLVVIIGLFASLFSITVLYCFRRRGISARAGAFPILILAVGCGAAFVSLLGVQGAQLLRDAARDVYSGSGELLSHPGGDPTGAGLVAAQSPKFLKPTDGEVQSWLSWQRQLRDHLTREVYELDFSSTLQESPDFLLQRESAESGLIRKEFAIPATDGDFIPAVLLLPETSDRPLRGILFLHGHVRDGGSGLAQMVLPIESYQRSAARELALAGFATLTIELRGFGLRGPPEFPNHHVVAFNAILAGSFYKKLVFSDIKRAMDLFEKLPEVDRDRLGISGVSLGGELAVEYAALDKRLKAIAFHAHGGTTGPYPGRVNPRTEPLHYCHLIPAANEIMQREDPFLLLAPRPTQGVRGARDPFAEPQFVSSLHQLWSLMGNTAALDLQVVEGPAIYRGHSYIFERSIPFFEQYL